MSQTRKNYSKEFKLHVINDRNSGMILLDVASKHYIHTTQVHDCTRKNNEIGDASFIDMRGKYNSPLRVRPKKKFNSLDEELEYSTPSFLKSLGKKTCKTAIAYIELRLSLLGTEIYI